VHFISSKDATRGLVMTYPPSRSRASDSSHRHAARRREPEKQVFRDIPFFAFHTPRQKKAVDLREPAA
jgi:hypothetical protein